MWGSMFGKGKAYPELGGERGMWQGWYGAIGKLAIAALLIGAVLIWRKRGCMLTCRWNMRMSL